MPVLGRREERWLAGLVRRRSVLGALLSAVVLWGCTSDPSDAEVIEADPTVEPSTSTGSSSVAVNGDSWRSTEIVDGDTLYVSGPAGQLEVRIIGVNTPESGECFSEEATDALAELVVGNDLVLVADRSDVDQFGRALRYVETIDGVDVGAELVADGFAIARRYPPDDARADRYADLQRDAQAAGRGLWAPDACGASDVDGVEIVIDVNADAPGDDGENLNGEWVRFTNAGSEAIDLDGWEVADESASHRYTFGSLRLESGAEVTLFSGCGPDDESARYWCVSGSAVWNNSGDTVFLRDRNGNIVASLSYGELGLSTGEAGFAAQTDQSPWTSANAVSSSSASGAVKPPAPRQCTWPDPSTRRSVIVDRSSMPSGRVTRLTSP